MIGRNQMIAAPDNADDNAEPVLAEAGMGWAHLVRLNWHVKASVLEEFWETGHPEPKTRFDRFGCRASGTLLGVDSLAEPGLLGEFEGTAAAPIDS